MKNTHFTLDRQPDAEAHIKSLLSRINYHIKSIVKPQHYRSLVLLGGYGKGEGGIVRTPNGLTPHNNFDLLLVTQKMGRLGRRKIEKTLSNELNQLAEKLGVGIDISVMSDLALENMPTRVIWYDMRYGHRIIDGDDKFISSIQHNVSSIPSWDIRNLMVNRGTLLLINNLCLLNKELSTDTKKLIIKHTMKAIVGYGDALLFYLGKYNWSYAEKRNRILAHSDIPVRFKRLYDDAINFRFNPKYELYLEKDLKSWQADITKQLSAIHLECEKTRLNSPNLNWDNYLSTAITSMHTERDFSLKETLKRLFSLFSSKQGRLPHSMSLKERIAYKSANEDSILPLIYPYLAFNPRIKGQKQALIRFFTSHLNQPTDARLRTIVAAYLKRWGLKFDKSLVTVLQQNKISI